MVTLFGQHDVTDYKTWKRNFDAMAGENSAEWGIAETRTYRTVDGSAVIVAHTFNTLEDAQNHKNRMELMPEDKIRGNGGQTSLKSLDC